MAGEAVFPLGDSWRRAYYGIAIRRMANFGWSSLVVFTALFAQTAVLAQTTEKSSAVPDVISEVRFGVLAHDGENEKGPDINAEILFVAPGFLDILWSPRPHLGGSLNLAGDTSQAYLGLTWDFDFTDWLFVEGSLGGAVHNGKLDPPGASDRAALGCRMLFRESLSLGVRFWEHHSVSAIFDHISNAEICSPNQGLNTFGIRYGYRF